MDEKELLRRTAFLVDWRVTGAFALLLFAWFEYWRYWRRTHAPRDHPWCYRCRYDARGLPGTTCPECGSDLSGEGLVAPFARVRMPNGRVRIAWTIFVAFASAPLSAAALRVGLVPRPHHCHGQLALLSPRSGKYGGAGIMFSTDVGFRKIPPLNQLWVSMGGPPNRSANWCVGAIDPNLSYIEVTEGDDRKMTWAKNIPDEESVTRFYQLAGIDTSDPAVQREARELLHLLNQTIDLPQKAGDKEWFQSTVWARRQLSEFTPAIGPTLGFVAVYPVWYLALAVVFWMVVWWIGFACIAMRKSVQRDPRPLNAR